MGLASCQLIDQRSFHPPAAAPAAGALNRPALPQRPLVTIGLAMGDVAWRAPLGQAVLAAQARKADVAFDVVTLIPASASQPEQDQAARLAGQDAEMVARELHKDGVPPERITLRLQGDPGTPSREVLIFVH